MNDVKHPKLYRGKPIFRYFDPERPGAITAEYTPSILSSDFANEAHDLGQCRRARAHWIHVDIMDGHFVPNITFGPPVLKKFTAAEPGLFYDTHLMIDEPMRYAEHFVKAGADLVNIHAETVGQLRRSIRAIKKLGVLAGVTIKPRTPLKTIVNVLDEVDMVLIMTVEPGFGGQGLIPRTLNKVRELNLIRTQERLPLRIQVDGGINAETAALAVAAGADVLVAGNAVFAGGDIAGNLKKLRESLK